MFARVALSTHARHLARAGLRNQTRSFGLLKGIDPVLSANLLRILRQAGHGDEIAIVDCNFPAASTGPQLEVLAGVDAVQATSAICSVLPVDAFVDCACFYMGPNSGDEYPDLAKEVHDAGKKAIRVSTNCVVENDQ